MYSILKIQPKFVDDQITQKWITHFYQQKTKKCYYQSKNFAEQIYRENKSKKSGNFFTKTFYFMLYITSFQKTKKFIEFRILRSIILKSKIINKNLLKSI